MFGASRRRNVFAFAFTACVILLVGCASDETDTVSVGQLGNGGSIHVTHAPPDLAGGSSAPLPTADAVGVVLGDYILDVPARFKLARDPIENTGGPGGGSFVSQLFVDDQGIGLTVSIHQGIDLARYFGRDGDPGIVAALSDGRDVYAHEPFGPSVDGPVADGLETPRWIEMAVDLGDGASLWINSPELLEDEILDLVARANARKG